MIRMLPILLAAAIQVNAQQDTSKNWSLQECLNLALQKNQTLQVARLDEENGLYKTREVRSQAMPQVNVTGSFTDNVKKQVLVLPGEFVGQPGKVVTAEMGTTYNGAANAQLTQQLFNQQVFTGLKAAKSSEAYYALSTRKTEEDVIFNVTQLYYNLQVTQQKKKVVSANIDKLDKLVASTTDQYKVGLAKKIDLDRIRVSLTNALSEQTSLDNNIDILTKQLKYTIGVDVDMSMHLPEMDLKAVEATSGNAVSLMSSFDLTNRTEFKILEQQAILLDLQKKAYQAEYYPSLSFVANYAYNGVSNKFDFFKTQNNGSTALWYDNAYLGLNLRVPIFNGLATKARVDQAKTQIKQLQQQKEMTEIGLKTAYQVAGVQLRNSLTVINTQRENMKLADDVYNSTQNNYSQGLATLTDVLNAATGMVEAQNNYNEALLKFKLAELELIRSNGNLRTLTNN